MPISFTPEQVIALLVKEQGNRSQRKFASAIGITEQYLSNVLNGRKNPGPAILRYLGLEVRICKADKAA